MPATTTGTEHTSNSWEKQGILKLGGAKSGAVDDANSTTDAIPASLRLVMAIWPNPDSETKCRILTILTR
jgi:hypothetical protein